MQTKLTLRLEDKLIEQAKFYAAQVGKSVSQIVADYFKLLTSEKVKTNSPLPPITQSLRGLLVECKLNEKDYKKQTLLGVTGSGKTFTMANIIARLQRPALVMCHNKTLAAQLYAEFKDFFPKSEVEYFVSYYDYYQPEAYVPQRDLYIEKDADINEEIDKLRHAATRALFERRDTLIVASVSCIYGLGEPEE